tara:strand:- start:8 stop:169 length:162 start_codon:yes stop_codon:yes gene_type:complete
VAAASRSVGLFQEAAVFMDAIQFHFQSSQSSTDRDPKYALKDGITEDKKAALV